MIAFIMRDAHGRQLATIGLSARDVRRMIEGAAKQVLLEEVGGEGQVQLFYEQTDERLLARVEAKGVVPQDAIVYRSPRDGRLVTPDRRSLTTAVRQAVKHLKKGVQDGK